MVHSTDARTRLVLVTPAAYDPVTFAARLADALAGGDVASLIITVPDARDPVSLQRAAETLVPIAEARGVAALIHNDTRTASRTNADGLHIDTGQEDVRAAVEAARGRRIVGAGNVPTRHDAMEIAEAEPDYIFFGRLTDSDTAGIFPKVRELAEWWSSVAVIPAIVMGGRSLDSVEEAAAAGIEFVALSAAIWDDPRGPGAAVTDVATRLARHPEAVS